jgi:hypothetical protein
MAYIFLLLLIAMITSEKVRASQPPRKLTPAGFEAIARRGAVVKLDGSASFSEENSPLSWSRALVSRPADSKADLVDADSAAPSFTPDVAGIYIGRLVASAGLIQSQPSTVVIAASPLTPSGTTGAEIKQ